MIRMDLRLLAAENLTQRGGDKGDPGDNKQSSAGHGDKDILVTYNVRECLLLIY